MVAISKQLIRNCSQKEEGIPLPTNFKTTIFSNIDQVIQLFSQQCLDFHTPIWLKWNCNFELNLKKQTCLEIQIDYCW